MCDHACKYFGKAFLLSKFNVNYFRCNSCGFIQTEKPYWLAEAYSSAISNLDVGLFSRNIYLSRVTRAVIGLFFDKKARFLDYGGGYGIFVRLMRDKGFDFYRYDKYCENLFARQFDVELDSSIPYELVTAFEVFEHFENPSDDIENILKFSSNILLSTELVPALLSGPDGWRYLGLEHGQHISFYTVKSLQEIAKRHGLNLITDGRYIHIFTRSQLPGILFRLICHAAIADIFNVFIRSNSLNDQGIRRTDL